MRAGNLLALGSFPSRGSGPVTSWARGAEHSGAANAMRTDINNCSPTVMGAPRETWCSRILSSEMSRDIILGLETLYEK